MGPLTNLGGSYAVGTCCNSVWRAFAVPLRAEAAAPGKDPLAEALSAIDPDALSPREALEAIYRLKAMQAKGER